MVVAMVTKLVAMVTIMVAMEIEPVAMEFMAVTSETKVGCQTHQLYEQYNFLRFYQ